MDTSIGLAAIWSSLVLASCLFFKSSWLNSKGPSAARWAPWLAWAGFVSLLSAVVAWLFSDRTPISMAVLGEGFFGLRLDALSVTLLLLVTFLGGVVLRYSRSYLAGDPRHRGRL